MTKKIIIVLFVFLSIGYFGYLGHLMLLNNIEVTLPFSLKKLYLFHAGFSTLVGINIILISKIKKVLEQIGFIYLGSLFIKIMLFIAAFYPTITSEEKSSLIIKLSILIPTFLFLLIELLFVVKFLKRKL
ncbi:DUF6168 family protein [uncultured Polaribacter sp.]|uniref:DUF6168 family protein n=1 Tax=uncultured Polaribacter sp. TaxID=174711 RepID=UPI00262FBB2C|nr:DUF6168 family protein [uncultured Polaribacter sp.]